MRIGQRPQNRLAVALRTIHRAIFQQVPRLVARGELVMDEQLQPVIVPRQIQRLQDDAVDAACHGQMERFEPIA